MGWCWRQLYGFMPVAVPRVASLRPLWPSARESEVLTQSTTHGQPRRPGQRVEERKPGGGIDVASVGCSADHLDELRDLPDLALFLRRQDERLVSGIQRHEGDPRVLPVGVGVGDGLAAVDLEREVAAGMGVVDAGVPDEELTVLAGAAAVAEGPSDGNSPSFRSIATRQRKRRWKKSRSR